MLRGVELCYVLCVDNVEQDVVYAPADCCTGAALGGIPVAVYVASNVHCGDVRVDFCCPPPHTALSGR